MATTKGRRRAAPVAAVNAAGDAFPVVPGATQRISGRLLLSELFPGDGRNSVIRDAIARNGVYREEGGRELHVRTRKEGEEYRVMAIAAVARDPGTSQSYIDTIQDYFPGTGTLGAGSSNRATEITQLWSIYQNEGIINNAINKIAAILSGGGRFKVRHTRKGKKQKAVDELQGVLEEFRINVNNTPDDGIVSGDRGLQSVTHQAVRSALVEGDWFGRSVWIDHPVGTLGTFSLPMIIQSIPASQIETDKSLGDLGGVDRYFWVPPRTVVEQIRNPADKDIKELINRLIPKDIQKPLLKDNRVLLDPALLFHVKHRGVAWRTYGESFIDSAKSALAFKKSVENLDFVSMNSLINRLTIVMVGSSDATSPYSKADVALARTALMQSFFDEAGPNMTIIWEGDDIDIKTVSAHEGVLDLNERHRLAEQKVKLALGVPDALLSGSMSDGKAAGWAAVIGASAELEELQNAFSNAWTTTGMRIALENGYTDVDLVFEFDKSLLVDKGEERNQMRNDYVVGAASIRSLILSRGGDPEAEFAQMCFEKGLDPNTTTWADAFAPPVGLQGQGAGKVPGNGRTPDGSTGTQPGAGGAPPANPGA
jgi:hypothetical protein